MKKPVIAVLAISVLAVVPSVRSTAQQRNPDATVQQLRDEAARMQELFEQQLRAVRERESDEAARARAMMEEVIAQARNAQQEARARADEQARALQARAEDAQAKAEAQERAVRAKADEQAARAARDAAPPPAQLVNIRIEVTVIPPGPKPTRKTVSVTVADGGQGSVRSLQGLPFMPPTERSTPSQDLNMINVDARPRIVRDGRVHAAIVIEYRGGSLAFDPLLENGKPLTVAQVPDPASDVVTTLEVTATVLK